MTARELVYHLVESGRVIPKDGKVILFRQNGMESRCIKMNKGYQYWEFRHDGKYRRVQLAQLVWLAHGNKLIEGMSVDHIDRNRSNNHISNLRLATPKQQRANATARYNTDLRTSKDRQNEVVRMLNSGFARREISRKLKMHRSTISNIQETFKLESRG